MTVLALDPSLTGTGWAYREPAYEDVWVVTVGTIHTKLTGIARLLYIQNRVAELIAKIGPTLVAYEGYAFAMRQQQTHAHSQGELGGVLKTYIYLAGIPLLLVPPKCLKKFATGSGNSDKEEVRKAMARHRGKLFKTNDEADAYALLLMGEAVEDRSLLPRLKQHPQRAAIAGCELIRPR